VLDLPIIAIKIEAFLAALVFAARIRTSFLFMTVPGLIFVTDIGSMVALFPICQRTMEA
jgi:hypothetical protein